MHFEFELVGGVFIGLARVRAYVMHGMPCMFVCLGVVCVCVCQISKNSIFCIRFFTAFLPKNEFDKQKTREDKTTCCRLLLLFSSLFILATGHICFFYGTRFRFCSFSHFSIFSLCMFHFQLQLLAVHIFRVFDVMLCERAFFFLLLFFVYNHTILLGF